MNSLTTFGINATPDGWLQGFTGRNEELHLLNSWLNNSNPLPVFVIGMAGAGKTTLCIAYRELFKSNYTGSIHISCAALYRSNDFEQALRSQIAQHIQTGVKANFDLPSLVNRAVARSGGKPFLFLVDDVDALPLDVFDATINIFRPLLVRNRVIFSARGMPITLESAKLQHRTLWLEPITLRDVKKMIQKLLAASGKDASIANAVLKRLRELGTDWTKMSPRFIKQLLNNYFHIGQIDSALLQSINTYFAPVTNLAISQTDNGLKILPLGHLGLSGIITPTSGIITALPYVVIPNYKSFWKNIIEEFEDLINNVNATENRIQKFFERHPQFLKSINYEKVIAHPVLERDDDGDLIPDFFLKPRRSEFVDVLDLKLPAEKIIVGKPDRKKLSGSVTEAIAQVREYRDYFERPDYRERVQRKYGVKGYRPSTIVVIGRDPEDVPEEKVRQILSDAPSHLQIMTYDDLHDRMKAMAEKNLL